ncbi:MAG TPA: transketolase [Actinopolymorphaceae bacterium]|nr:transketolase [Actinopolymorphaceae bacterium]
MTDMRTSFVEAAVTLLDDDPRTAVVLADISSDLFEDAARRHPDRVLNVGIREPLMVSVAGGLALSGMRPIAHSYAPFLIERSFEQVKLDLSHQGASAVLVSVGASYDSTGSGRTHHAPGDVALMDTLPSWAVHVPGHADEAATLVSRAVGADRPAYVRLSSSSNADAHHPATPGALTILRTGRRAVVLVVGPLLDPVLEATRDIDVTVAYASTVRPLDLAGLRQAAAATVEGTHEPVSVVLVEPYLAATSARLVGEAFVDRPHRLLSLGVDRIEARRYGSPADHDTLYGLDPTGLRGSITAFLQART